MIQCISSYLNKIKNQRPIRITHTRTMCATCHVLKCVRVLDPHVYRFTLLIYWANYNNVLDILQNVNVPSYFKKNDTFTLTLFKKKKMMFYPRIF